MSVQRISAALLAIALLFTGCTGGSSTSVKGSGTLKTESRTVQGFDRVVVKGFGNVTLTQGDSEALSIEADDNLFQYIVAEVSGSTLTVGVQDNVSLTDATLRFTVALKALQELSITGAGSIDAQYIKSDSLTVKLNGGGSFLLTGSAQTQTINLEGSGRFDGKALTGKTASVTISGAAAADVSVTDKLDVTINGAGSVMYTGSPEVKQTINGAGSVQHVGS